MTLKHVLKLFSKTEVQEDKTHPNPPLEKEGASKMVAQYGKPYPNHLSQMILNRLFGRVLEMEGELSYYNNAECYPLPLREREELLCERSELSNSGEGCKDLPSPDATRHPLPGEGKKVLCVEPRQNKTHPNPPLEREGVNASCGKHTIKNLFTYLPIHLFTFKKCAFTLAEVLITLGIIGVVAALTLPSLIANYQKQVYVNQLKSAYSILGQGFKKMLADEGVDSLWDIPEFANSNYCFVGDNASTNCLALTNKLQKYFKFTTVRYQDVRTQWIDTRLDQSYSGDIEMAYGLSYLLLFSNNQLISMQIYPPYIISSSRRSQIKDLGGHLTELVGYFWIDINGYKHPNIIGRDIFCFIISGDGNLYPSMGIDYALHQYQTPLESNSVYWRHDSHGCGDPNSSNIDGSFGQGCAARIIENGWKMDY